MIEMIYHTLERVGFTHPLHPAVTHIPMGMVMGAFIFTAVSIYLRKSELMATAHHCALLGFIFVLPTMLFGYMDWQYRFDGEWSGLIIFKMILAVCFLVTLGIASRFGNLEQIDPKKMLILYAICLGMAIGLGFSGGELQYG